MKEDLNGLEKDFVEFIALQQGRSFSEIERLYCGIRDRFNCFKGSKFEKFGGNIHEIFRIYHDTNTEENAIKAYQFYSVLHLLVFISYSYPKGLTDRLQDAWKLFRTGQFRQILQFGARYLRQSIKGKGVIESLMEHISSVPVVVDYGCGLAYFSSEIARRNKSAKIYLVDIGSIILDFTVFRFQKYKYDFEVIKITEENIYPTLPVHNICIADEVMEHVFQPLKVYNNIHTSMIAGGLLFGNFTDHSGNMFHVSPDLSCIRAKIGSDYEKLGTKIFRKIR